MINLGKMMSRQFQYVEMELQQMAEACSWKAGAILKVAFENGYLTDDLKTIACKIVKRTGADYARTSTPFGPSPFTLDDVALMKRLLGDRVKIKASGGVRTISGRAGTARSRMHADRDYCDGGAFSRIGKPTSRYKNPRRRRRNLISFPVCVSP